MPSPVVPSATTDIAVEVDSLTVRYGELVAFYVHTLFAASHLCTGNHRVQMAHTKVP